MADVTFDLQIKGEQAVMSGMHGVAGALGNLASVAGGMLLSNVISGIANQIGALVPQAIDAIGFTERLGMSLQSLTARELLNEGAAKTMGAALEMAAAPAEELMGWITQLALKSPFDREGVATAFRTAMAYGFSADQAQRLTSATVDYTAATGAGTSEVNMIALALGQMQAKGKVAGQELLQLVNAGVPALKILAEHFGVTTGEMQDMISSGMVPADEAFDAIVTSMEEDFGGAAERQAETVTGLVNAFGDLKEMGLEAFFGGIAESVKPLASRFAEWLQSGGLELLTQWGESVGAFAAEVVTWVDLIIGKISDFAAFAGDEGIFGALAEFDILPDNIGLLVDALDNLSTAWQEKLPEIQAIVQGFTDWLGEVFAIAGPQIVESLSSIINSIAALWAEYGDEIMTVVTFAWEVVITTIGGALTLLLGLIQGFLLILQGDWSGAWEAISGSFLTFFEMALSIAGTNAADFLAVWSSNLALLGTIITAGLNAAAAKIGEVLSTFAAKGGELATALVNGIIEGLKAGAGAVINAVLAIMNDSIDAVKTFFGIQSPSSVMAEIGQNLMQGLSLGIAGAGAAPGAAILSAGQALVEQPVGAPGGGGLASIVVNLYADVLDEVSVARVFDVIDAEAARRGLVLGGEMAY